jgi:hypothetical protein
VKRFRDTFTDRTARYSLGIDDRTGNPYLSIPVTIRVVDYEEYYTLSVAEYEHFLGVPADAASFADACRRHERDDRLVLQPGWNRGTPM